VFYHAPAVVIMSMWRCCSS